MGRQWGDFPAGQYDMSGISLLPEHLNWMRRNGRAERTVRARRVEVVKLREWLGFDPAEATYDQLDSWQSTLPSPENLRWVTAMIRPYYRYLHLRGLRPDNPAALLPLPAPPRRLPRPISEERLALAIGKAPDRIFPWLLLAGWCGLRAGGIASLHVESFQRTADGEMVVYYIAKGGHEENTAVPEWVWQTISPGLPPSGPCFRQVRGDGAGWKSVTAQHVSQYCNEYLRSVGIPDTLHGFRHRVGTILLEQTGDIRLVQRALGHRDISSAALYTRVASKRLHDAMSAVPPPRLLRPVPVRGVG